MACNRHVTLDCIYIWLFSTLILFFVFRRLWFNFYYLSRDHTGMATLEDKAIWEDGEVGFYLCFVAIQAEFSKFYT